MSIHLACECGHPFETPGLNAGHTVQCPACRRELTVPRPTPPSEVMSIEGEAGSKITSGKAIASLMLGVLFFFACLSGIPAIILGRMALGDIKRSDDRLGGRRMAIAGIVLGVIGCLFTLMLMPAIRSSREAARRAQCVNNLEQIGLALHNYQESNGCLPPAAITDKDGRPLLSWRVAILPYLQCDPRYADFHLDEPWDSPHNLALLEPTPFFYTCPSDATLKPGMTGYMVVLGPHAAFTPDFKPSRFQDFTDGLPDTLLVGESRRPVPWTKPEDLPFDVAIPLLGLGSHHGHHDNDFNVLLGDGSVRFLKSPIAPGVLNALISRDGNQMEPSSTY